MTDRLRGILERYDEPLLRLVAGKLVKPRGQWPVEELIDRCVATLANVAVIDRRLKEQDASGQRLLALIGRSREYTWSLGNLIELVMALGHPEGLPPVLALFEAGLLFPDLPESVTRLKNFEQWLGQAGSTGLAAFTLPLVTGRALDEDLGLPTLAANASPGPVQEADGLEWPLRLSVLWQMVFANPLRRTQQGDFFKRDQERLTQDTLLCSAPADSLAEIPDAGLLTVAMAESTGIVQDQNGELRAGSLPASWEEGLPATLAGLWSACLHLDGWDPIKGWKGKPAAGLGNPFPSAYLLLFTLLAQLPSDAWANPEELQAWLWEHHPYWANENVRPSQRRNWVNAFLLGVAFQMRWVQATRDKAGVTYVRLSPMGRWLLGKEDKAPQPASFGQTMLVQPNLEIVTYRQGLTPMLIAQLSRFAGWTSLGAACLLQLGPDSVYRGLESGMNLTAILQALERSSMRALPPAVVDSLQTWAGKRERITIYPSATLFEFASEEDLNDAIARGVAAIRISDRLAAVASEGGIDFKHFRLMGSRDYALPPEKCIEVASDGVTLSIDITRADLLVETELRRFAEPVEVNGQSGPRQYRLTPTSLATGRDSGFGLRALEEWFPQRTGQPVSAAARLLVAGSQLPPAEVHRRFVLHVATPDLADGMVQWPGTRALIESRLGPTTLAVAEENLSLLRERLATLGMQVQI